jgi:deoxyribose-phosphate aldolase
LKVILETGELKSEENIRKASKIAMDAGADFIKTSTGKIQPAATLEAMFYMLEEIREFYQRTEKKIGIKPAGGISTAEHAIDYYLLVENILGEDWLKPELFRIGASRLAGNILSFLKL